MKILPGVFAALFIAAAGFAAPEGGLTGLALGAARDIKAGRFDAALSTLDVAMKKYPRSPDIDLVYWLNCKALIGKADATAAVTYCSAAIKRNPKNANFFIDRADAYYRLGDGTRARGDIEAAKAAGGKKAVLFGLDARIAWDDGDVAAAETALRAALALDRGEKNARFVQEAIRRSRLSAKAAPPAVKPSPRIAPPVPPAPPQTKAPQAKAAPPPPPQAKAAPPPPAPPPVLLAKATSPDYSVDCSRPIGIEKAICRDDNLLRRDRDVQALFRRALAVAASPDDMAAAQHDWIQLRRNACDSRDCLAAVYAERKAELMLWLGY
jgi:tetratricopeptide (TPR) repeat protein